MKIDLKKGKIGKLKLNKKLLRQALTHPNYTDKNVSHINFETLEFLGDAVLDLLVAEWLLDNIKAKVGTLSKLRAILVQSESLAELALSLGVKELMLVEKNYKIVQADLEDCLEALFGVTYLSKGVKGAKTLFQKLFRKKLKEISEKAKTKEGLQQLEAKTICEKNPVNELQEFCQKHSLPLPEYDMVQKHGPDHDPTYVIKCTVKVNNKTYSDNGSGRNMKEARKVAASKVIEIMKKKGEPLLN